MAARTADQPRRQHKTRAARERTRSVRPCLTPELPFVLSIRRCVRAPPTTLRLAQDIRRIAADEAQPRRGRCKCSRCKEQDAYEGKHAAEGCRVVKRVAKCFFAVP